MTLPTAVELNLRRQADRAMLRQMLRAPMGQVLLDYLEHFFKQKNRGPTEDVGALNYWAAGVELRDELERIRDSTPSQPE